MIVAVNTSRFSLSDIVSLLEEEFFEAFELSWVGFVLCSLGQLIVILFNCTQIILQVSPETISVVEADELLGGLHDSQVVTVAEVWGNHLLL